jgi:hypothetical protein
MKIAALALAGFFGTALTAAVAIPANAEWYTIRTKA